MQKRILIFSLAYYPDLVGGAEVAVKEITDRLGGDFEFDMVTLRASGKKFERLGNVNIYRVGLGNGNSGKVSFLSKYLYIFLAFFKAVSLHRKKKYDLTWSIMANYAGFSALFFKIFFKEVPFVLTLQEGDPFLHIKKRVGLLWPLFKKIFTHADRVQAISNYLACWAIDMGFKQKPVVVPNGVDIAHFTATIESETLSCLEEQIEKGRDDVLLVTTSRLVKKNGIEDILKAMTYLSEDVKFLILGTGPDENKLRGLAEELNMATRVKFLGYVPHAEMLKYLKISDIFVRPSLSEGLGNSFLEAMCAGLPIVATLVGGIPDFLIHKKTGIAAKVSDPADLAEKIQMLINEKELREEIIKNGKELVVQDYDWDKLAERMKREVFQAES
jgi:glycosyltransferase involved in cell wall biosynthesis